MRDTYNEERSIFMHGDPLKYYRGRKAVVAKVLKPCRKKGDLGWRRSEGTNKCNVKYALSCTVFQMKQTIAHIFALAAPSPSRRQRMPSQGDRERAGEVEDGPDLQNKREIT